MRQFLAIFIAFLTMPLWRKKKLGFGPTLLLTGCILSLVAGLDVSQTVHSFTAVFTTPNTVYTIMAVILVGVLGNLLKQYKILDQIVSDLKVVIHSKKAIIMMLPAVMGLLSVPGGAHLSAPFVDSVGEELGMPPQKRAAVNLSFRHMSMFLLPFHSNMIFVTTVMPEINLYHLIALNAGFVILMQLGAYFFYLRNTKNSQVALQGDRTKALGRLILYLSPVYMVMVFNAILNRIFAPVSIPMCASVFLCVVLTFFLIGKDKKDFLQHSWKGISFSTLGMLIGVYFVQNLVKNLDQVIGAINTAFVTSSGFTILLIVAATAVLFGLTTGLSLVPMGIILPLVATLPLSYEMRLLYTFFVFAWSFLGYYYSPLHLCQLLTVKYMNVTSGEMYREHAKMVPYLMTVSFVLFYLYQFLLV